MEEYANIIWSDDFETEEERNYRESWEMLSFEAAEEPDVPSEKDGWKDAKSDDNVTIEFNSGSDYVWKEYGRSEAMEIAEKLARDHPKGEQDLFNRFFGDKSPFAKLMKERVEWDMATSLRFYQSILLCSQWNKTFAYLHRSGDLQHKLLLDLDDFNRMLKEIGSFGVDKEERGGSRHMWKELSTNLNTYWMDTVLPEKALNLLIAVDDDKATAAMKAAWRANIKIRPLGRQGAMNDKGIVIITGALVVTGIPLVAIPEEATGSSRGAYSDVLRSLSRGSTQGPPTLSHTTLASDRYFSSTSIVYEAVRGGAHWIGTVKRGPTSPFTYQRDPAPGQVAVPSNGAPSLYGRSRLIGGKSSGVELSAIAHRTGVASGAVAMVWTTFPTMPMMSYDYRVGPKQLGDLAKEPVDATLFGDALDTYRHFFVLPLRRADGESTRASEFSCFPALLSSLPVRHLCIGQAHAGWFILRRFRMTSRTVQAFFTEYRRCQPQGFESVFATFYGPSASPARPPDEVQSEAVADSFAGHTVDSIRVSCAAEDGVCGLEVDVIDAVCAHLGVEVDDAELRRRVAHSWAAADTDSMEHEAYKVLTKQQLRGMVNVTSGAKKPDIIRRLIDQRHPKVEAPDGLLRIIKSSFMPQLRGEALKNARLGHANESKLLRTAVAFCRTNASVRFTIEEVVTCGLVERRSIPGLATSVDGLAVARWKDEARHQPFLACCEVKTRTTVDTVAVGQRRLSFPKETVYEEVDAVDFGSFRGCVYDIAEAIQLAHHAATFNLLHVLFIVGSKDDLLALVLVRFTPNFLAMYANLCSLWIQEHLSFAHPRAPGESTTDLDLKKVAEVVEKLPEVPDVHTVVHALAVWNAANEMVPLPRTNMMLPTLSSIWDAAKGGSDTISGLVSAANFDLETSYPVAVLVRRLLLLNVVAYHRCRALLALRSKIATYDSLKALRAAMNRHGSFNDTLQDAEGRMRAMLDTDDAETRKRQRAHPTRASGSHIAVSTLGHSPHQPNTPVYSLWREWYATAVLSGGCVGVPLTVPAKERHTCVVCTMRGRPHGHHSTMYCAQCGFFFCTAPLDLWHVVGKDVTEEHREARDRDGQGLLQVRWEGRPIRLQELPKFVTLVHRRDAKVQVRLSCWLVGHLSHHTFAANDEVDTSKRLRS